MNINFDFSDSNLFELNTDVQDALTNKKPIVALESTLISHGLPEPDNLNTAIALEEIIKEQNVIPATIAIINGKVKVGLSFDELQQLASKENEVVKLSKKDLSAALLNKKIGTTTVAATLVIAKKLGIKVFATGGIGGVHLDANETFDISTDLTQLAQSELIVVCSGAKAILDINKTCEFLETLGVTIIGYGTNSLPGFWYRETENKVDLMVNSIDEIIETYKHQLALGIKSSLLVCNPIPKVHALAKEEVLNYLNQATQMASKANITGKDISPFLLAKMAELSNNKTLTANIELLKANASLAAKIAKTI